MASRISELVIKCQDPQHLAAFWSEVLGYNALDTDYGAAAVPQEGFGGLQPSLIFISTKEPRTAQLPLHIDINATDRDQDTELERLLNLGARPVDIGQTGDESWHVLADPEGNEFCLLQGRLT